MSYPSPNNLTANLVLQQVVLSWGITSVVPTVFSSSGVWTNDHLGLYVDLTVIGGGGGGASGSFPGSGNPGAGGGAGGGGRADSFRVPMSSLTGTANVIVGAAGLGSTAGASNATSGGDSWFGGNTIDETTSYLYATGGTFGRPTGIATAAGGSGVVFLIGAGGDSTGVGGTGALGPGIVFSGSPPPPPADGGPGSNNAPGGGAAGGGQWNSVDQPGGAGGAGGPPYAGPGGAGGASHSPPINGSSPASGFGGGGGGGGYGGTTGGAGGNGAGGAVIVTETYPAPNSYNVYRNGSLIANVSSAGFVDTAPPAGLIVYDVKAVYGSTESGAAEVSITVQAGPTYGKFVGSRVFKAVVISQVGKIIPRIWPSKKNNTVYG